jgi:hypothetical protein
LGAAGRIHRPEIFGLLEPIFFRCVANPSLMDLRHVLRDPSILEQNLLIFDAQVFPVTRWAAGGEERKSNDK